MAFVTTFISPTLGPGNAYNIDFPVGVSKHNARDDIMLAQALFRIVHFEVSKPIPPPPGETEIAVNGQLTPATLRFITNWQLLAKGAGIKVLVDGTFDPFRAQGQLSTIAHVRYTLELLNNTCHAKCIDDDSTAYTGLPKRTDIPEELRNVLNLPQRTVAKQYLKG